MPTFPHYPQPHGCPFFLCCAGLGIHPAASNADPANEPARKMWCLGPFSLVSFLPCQRTELDHNVLRHLTNLAQHDTDTLPFNKLLIQFESPNPASGRQCCIPILFHTSALPVTATGPAAQNQLQNRRVTVPDGCTELSLQN